MNNTGKILDGLLVLQFRSGSKKALEALVQRYHSRLCQHAYWYTNDIEASKDIVQDSWGVVIKKVYSLKEPNSFGSWIFRIVTRKSLDYVTKLKKNRILMQQVQAEEIFNEDKREQWAYVLQLRKAIKTLSIEHQLVIRLFYTEDYSLREIAEILEISIGTVKSRLFHGREKLKSILLKFNDG